MEEIQKVIGTFLPIVENWLHIEFSEMQENTKRIKIIDFMGRDISTTETRDNSLDIDFSDKPSGVYLVQTIIGLQVINKKIVKR